MNSNAGLDEYIRRPVALSLRAAGGYQEQTYNTDLFKNLRSGHEGEDTFDVLRLDLWDFPTEGRSRTHLYEPVHLNASGRWLADVLDPKQDERFSKEHGQLKFRLLLTHPPLEYRWPWRPRIHDLSDPGLRQIDHTPFVLKDMKKLIRGFHLPRDWLYLRLHAKGAGNFFRKTDWDFETGVAQRVGFVVNFPFVLSPSRRYTGPSNDPDRDRTGLEQATTSEEEEAMAAKLRNGDPYIWSVAYSHNLTEGTTNGIFDGVTDWTSDDLCERLQADKAFWSSHPLYLLMVLLDIYVGFAAMESKTMDVTEHRLEAKSRKDLDELERYISRFGDQSRKLADLQRMLDFSLKLVDFLSETLQYLEDPKVLPQRWMSTSSANEDRFSRRAYFERAGVQMRESLMNTSYFLKNHTHRCECLQKHTSDELSIIQALYSQRNTYDHIKLAKESHENTKIFNEIADTSKVLAYDASHSSTSNMTISVIAIAFLPAMFISTVFSTGFFDWQEKDIVVSSHFWIYWAVVIPVTIVVIGAWFAWFLLYRNPMMDRERARQECEECRRLCRLKHEGRQFCAEHGPDRGAGKRKKNVKAWRHSLAQFQFPFGRSGERIRIFSDSSDPEAGLKRGPVVMTQPSTLATRATTVMTQSRALYGPLPPLPTGS